MDFQTRSEETGLKAHGSLKTALDHAARDHSVWKVSFTLETGERVRLVRTPNGWVYENVLSTHGAY